MIASTPPPTPREEEGKKKPSSKAPLPGLSHLALRQHSLPGLEVHEASGIGKRLVGGGGFFFPLEKGGSDSSVWEVVVHVHSKAQGGHIYLPKRKNEENHWQKKHAEKCEEMAYFFMLVQFSPLLHHRRRICAWCFAQADEARQKQLNLGKSWMHPRSLVGRWWLGMNTILGNRRAPINRRFQTDHNAMYFCIYIYSHVYVYEMVCNSMYACMYAYVHTTAGYKDLAHKIGPDPQDGWSLSGLVRKGPRRFCLPPKWRSKPKNDTAHKLRVSGIHPRLSRFSTREDRIRVPTFFSSLF